MALSIWKEAGFFMLFYLAGLQAIPADLNEAAILEGAGPWPRFRLYYIYETAFSFFDTSYAGTLTVVLLIILASLAYFKIQYLDKKVH